MSNTTCVKSYQTTAEAEFAKTILESNGIHAMVVADNIGGLAGGIDLNEGVKLMVLEEFVKRATELLEKSSET